MAVAVIVVQDLVHCFYVQFAARKFVHMIE